jgi:hypothetical protein
MNFELGIVRAEHASGAPLLKFSTAEGVRAQLLDGAIYRPAPIRLTIPVAQC